MWAIEKYLSWLPSLLSRHLYTLFLFTKSDIKTTVIPIVSPLSPLPFANTYPETQTFLAAASAPMTDIFRLPHAVFWIWFHLLQFDVSNQTLSPEEDENNKKDRPLPSKRITFQNAIFLRWALVPACWALSICYSVEVLYASIALVALTVSYDELGFHSMHWLVRNVNNAAGFAAFEVGATLIAGATRRHVSAWLRTYSDDHSICRQRSSCARLDRYDVRVCERGHFRDHDSGPGFQRYHRRSSDRSEDPTDCCTDSGSTNTHASTGCVVHCVVSSLAHQFTFDSGVQRTCAGRRRAVHRA